MGKKPMTDLEKFLARIKKDLRASGLPDDQIEGNMPAMVIADEQEWLNALTTVQTIPTNPRPKIIDLMC